MYTWLPARAGVALGLLPFRRLRTVAGTVAASLAVLLGMWLERFLILVPTQAQPRLGIPLRKLPP